MAPWGSGASANMTGGGLGGSQAMPGVQAGAVP
jgi:hypothetical protein